MKEKPLIPVIILLGIIIAFAAGNGSIGNSHNNGMSTAQNGSSQLFSWDSVVEKIQAPETTPGRNGLLVTTKLEGHFSPDNEKELIEQLVREGYIEFFSYRINDDGTALITAMQGQLPVQSIVAIVVDKNGNATRTRKE